MVQTNQTTNNVQFDPSTLSPEAMRWVDQQRTQASQTARRNLMKDEGFLNELRTQMQPQVQKTVEEQTQERMSALEKMVSTAQVGSILSKAGIPDEQISDYVSLFATSNIEESVEKATNFASVFANTVQSRVDAQQQQALVNMTTPTAPITQVTDQDSLQARYDEAKKDTSYMRGVKISQIMREASEKGITLK